MPKKRILPALGITVAFAAAIAGAFIILTRLGDIVIFASSFAGDAAETVSAIGAQIGLSPKTPHILLPAAIGIFFASLRFAFPPKGAGGRTLYILGGILLWITALAAALAFSRMGGIRIWDIVRSMAELIGGGILENL